MDRFNWALDYFDHLPADDLALWCVGETEEKLSATLLQTARCMRIKDSPRLRLRFYHCVCTTASGVFT
jgi:hypothetical protein